MRFIFAFLLAWLLSGASVLADPSGDASLNELLDGYQGLHLGPSGLAVSDREVEVGHMKLTLKEGTLFPLLGKGGAPLGFFFQGKGRYDYLSQDPADLQVLPLNLQRNAPRLQVRQNGIWDEFSNILVYAAVPLIEEIPPGGPAPDGSATGAFQRIWKRVSLTYLPTEHLAAQAKLNGGKLQCVYADIEGSVENVGYFLDQVRTFDEMLVSFRKFQGVDVLFAETLSRQAAVAEGETDATARLVDARIDLATSDNRSGTIVSDLTFKSERDGLRAFSMTLFNNRNEVSFNWAAKQNALRVTKVSDEGGKPVAFSHRYHEILVELPRPAQRGETFRLHFETEGDIFLDMGNSRDDSYFIFLGGGWYPTPFDPSFFTFHVKVKTRKPWTPVASGTTIALKESGDTWELESESAKPVASIAVLGGNYKVYEERIGNVSYRIHGYAMGLKSVLQNMPKLADALVRFYEAQLGPYPQNELDIVEIPSYGFGIAPSGLVLITTEAYKAHHDWLAEYLSGGINNRLAHEIAHQWFPHKAYPSDPSGYWLSESFAEYLAGMAMAATNPDERRVKGWKGMLAEWKGYSKECTNVALDRAYWMGGEKGGKDYWCLVYNRGPLVLHMFHTTIGDQAFFAVMKNILDQANFSLIDLEDVKAAQKAVLRTDMGWFFDDWAHKAGIPQVRLEYKVDTSGGTPILTGKVEQPSSSFIKLPIPLIIDYPDGKRDVRVFVQDDWSKPFQFELPAVPKKVTIDPANNNLAVYR